MVGSSDLVYAELLSYLSASLSASVAQPTLASNYRTDCVPADGSGASLPPRLCRVHPAIPDVITAARLRPQGTSTTVLLVRQRSCYGTYYW